MISEDKKTLIQNLVFASGAHGLNEVDLYKNLQTLKDIDGFIYTLKKAFELKGSEWLTSTHSISEEFEEKWSSWHHIDEQYSTEWGFKKNQPGCYIYGLFGTPPDGVADFLSENVFYIGESRAISRNCMLGRRGDFVSTVRNDPLCPYGCGTSFLTHFGKEKIDYVYQAYLPMPAHLCLKKETELLTDYYVKYQCLPKCNYVTDETRIKKLAHSLNRFFE
jgi:hypothetical protein